MSERWAEGGEMGRHRASSARTSATVAESSKVRGASDPLRVLAVMVGGGGSGWVHGGSVGRG